MSAVLAAAPPRPPATGIALRLGPFSRAVRPRAVTAGLLLVALAAVTFVAGLAVGDLPLAPGEIVRALAGGGDEATRFVVVDLRLPRALTALLVGAALGMSGAVTQALTRNPLASPDLLGVTAGAGAAAVAVLVLAGGSAAGSTVDVVASRAATVGVPLSALAGGLLTAVAVHLLATGSGPDGGQRLLLVGIGVGAALTAVTSWLLVRAEVFEARQAAVWLTGSLENRGWEHVVPVGLAVIGAGVVVVARAHTLGVLALGPDTAVALGIRSAPAARLLHAAAVVLAAVATASAGPIAFVALVAPHLVRRTVGGGPAPVLAGLTGAVLVLAADVLARAVLPGALPVGLVTAAVGAPFLLQLLAASPRRAAR